MKRAWLAVATIGITCLTQPAYAERKTMEAAITSAMAAGEYLQAIANLERMRESAAISSGDRFVREQLTAAWSKYFDSQIGAEAEDQRPSLQRLAKLDWVVRVATEHRVPNRDHYQNRLDNMVKAVVAAAGPAQRFSAIADASRVAPSSSAAREAASKAKAELEAVVGKVTIAGPFGAYVRQQLLSYYDLAAPPEHPQAIQLAFSVEQRGDQCAKAVAATQAKLAAGAGLPVKATFAITGCATTDSVSEAMRGFAYQSPVKVKKKVRKTVAVTRTEYKKVCYQVASGCSPSWGVPGTSTQQAGSCWTTTRCGDEPYEVKSYQEVDEEILVDDYETLYEYATVTRRTTTARLQGTFQIEVGGSAAQLTVDVSGEAFSESYQASQANASSSLRVTDDEAIADAAARLAAQVARAAEIGARTKRSMEIDSQLVTATGTMRQVLLAEWTAAMHRAKPEFVTSIVASTQLPVADVEVALRGQGRANHNIASFEVDVRLPYHNVAGANGLYDDEVREKMNHGTAHVAAVMFGLSASHNDGTKFGGGLVARISKTAGRFAFRPVVPYVMAEGAFDVGGGGGAGEAAIGYSLYGGAGLIAGGPVFNVGGFAFGGTDGIWLVEGDTPLTADSVRAPVSLSWGYGAHLNLGNKLLVRASRAMRSREAIPERWVAELLVPRLFTFGLRATVYQPLWGRDATNSGGPWQVLAFVGLTTEGKHFVGSIPEPGGY